MSVCEYFRIYLAVYGPEIIGVFGLEEKSVLRSRKNKLWPFAECATPYNRTFPVVELFQIKEKKQFEDVFLLSFSVIQLMAIYEM